MSDSHQLDRLERGLRQRREIAVAHRNARAPGAEGKGVTVSLRMHKADYVVCVEYYRDDGGYGETLSRNDHPFQSLEAALDEVARHGFTAEQLEF
ncbi:MAG: hypothetical protein HOV81_21650 [Kofleriaceae bacterium]|nr:hypothetical protein [Kofleriaceae bacterium]